ncbi:MAG: hypothetical protein H0X40_19990 [Chthoniobacterales bacterium]|nr:hypothetical protein [Chthoniobacterales bacterium]
MTDITLTRVETWALATAGLGDSQPRVHDLELAQHLGYERPRDIRNLIKSLARDGKLNGYELRGVQTQSGGRPATEFWLTQSQALKVVAKSETPAADAILDEVIRVFLAVTSGVDTRPPAVDDRTFALFQSMMAPVIEAISVVTKMVSDASGCRISGADASSVKRQVQVIAKMRAQSNPSSKGENSERRIIYNRLGAAVGWTGSGRRWDGLPASKVADVQALLREMHADSFRALPTNSELQLALFNGPKK